MLKSPRLVRRELRAMRVTILAGILVILASVAHASSGYGEPSSVNIVGSGSGDIKIASAADDTNMVIVGSQADDIKIVASGNVEDRELVESQPGAIPLASELEHEEKCKPCIRSKLKSRPHCRPLYYAMCENPDCYTSPKVKYDESHVGVDAWHGTYWFADSINLPKLPRVFGGPVVPIY
jgi:hypothetical protein